MSTSGFLVSPSPSSMMSGARHMLSSSPRVVPGSNLYLKWIIYKHRSKMQRSLIDRDSRKRHRLCLISTDDKCSPGPHPLGQTVSPVWMAHGSPRDREVFSSVSRGVISVTESQIVPSLLHRPSSHWPCHQPERSSLVPLSTPHCHY